MVDNGVKGPARSSYHPASAAARLAGVKPAQLRRYEQAGLVTPSRGQGRTRMYSELQVAEVRRIRRLHEDLGINLAGVDVILQLLELVKTLQALVLLPPPRGSPVSRRVAAQSVARRTWDGRE
jgi:MerR family transcriptional regulator/heat shock protein HspR